jgi:hypothetical protein
MKISDPTWAWLFAVPLIPSVIVAIFVLYHLLIDRVLRRALNNHVIILLLSCGLVESLTDIVWYIYYFRNGTSMVWTLAFCTVWVMTDSGVYVSIYILMAWASIERHILVFHPSWFGSKKTCFFFHYVPLALCILYPIIFYFIIFVIIPCDVPLNFGYRLCKRYACVSHVPWLSLWDSVGNYIVPAFITVCFSVALFIRVLYKKFHTVGRIQWKNYKKLTMQLLPISILYITLQLPPMILYAAYSAGLDWNVAFDYFVDSSNFTYWVVLFTPFACIVSLPGLRKRCKNLIFWRRGHAVNPQAFLMTRTRGDQTRTGPAAATMVRTHQH